MLELIRNYIKKKLPSNSIIRRVYRRTIARKYYMAMENAEKELYSYDNLSDKDANEKQNKKLTSILYYAYKKTDYYHNLFSENKISVIDSSVLKRIPILTKNTITNNINNMISKDYEKSELILRNTGGSTGEPLYFYSDKYAGVVDDTHHWYLYRIMGYKPGDVIVSCGGYEITNDKINNNIFWKENDKNSVWGQIGFSVLYLKEENIEFYINKLKAVKPSILRGYPSFYAALSEHILSNGIVFDFHVKGVNLTAEMCSDKQRDIIEKAFNCQVYFEYGHTEVCLYCYSKDNSYEYFSSPTYGYIEVLDDENIDVGLGEIGRIIVTGLNNRGMPFIRYDTGDLGVLKSRNGGIVSFSKIVGRNQDYIVSKSNDKVYLTALVFGQHFKAFENIKKWQITQYETGMVNIKIIPSANFSNNDEEEIRANFESVANVSVRFEYVNSIPTTKAGKHLFLIQNINR